MVVHCCKVLDGKSKYFIPSSYLLPLSKYLFTLLPSTFLLPTPQYFFALRPPNHLLLPIYIEPLQH